ncbi:MAG: RHS repeat-associated core domain-containing protein, partial [Saprospiraceae bacterium]|nr:RHS repeat-associated core domain-containing protein [Saprospiraceae bacterium]
EEITDPLFNTIRVKNDYVSLQPYELADPNGVISRVAFDALGAVVATGTIGKNGEGDPMQYFKVPYRYWESVALTDYYHEEGPQRLLDMIQDASAVMLYDLWRGVHLKIRDKTTYTTAPQAVLTFTREEHHSTNTHPIIQTKITYFDGLDRELQTKIQAEPDAQGNPRYIDSGWKIYNNKCKPVRQFEPFYAAFPYYESLEDIYRKKLEGQMGCSSVLFYDPLDRQVCVLHPNYTYEKIKFNAWEEQRFDVNDTVDQHPGNDPDIKGYVEKFLDNPQFCFGNAPAAPYITWADLKGMKDRAVQLSWKHRNTPTVAHLDTLGRAYKTVQTHTIDGAERLEYITTNQFDAEGNVLSVTDPRGVKCFEYQYDMTKRPLVVHSTDAGKKTMIPDVAGLPLWTTDAMQTQILTEYDALRRPTEVWVKKKNDKDYFLAGATVYGEAKSKTSRRGMFRRALQETDYFRGKVWKVYDGAGMVENTSFDFKGNILENKRSLIDSQTITTPEWTLRRSADPLQETSVIQGKNFGWGKTFVTQSAFDALNRVVSVTLPDGTVQQPAYNPSNLLKSVTVQGKPFVEHIAYNAKGQREQITYGNGVITRYTYEQETYRLMHLYSARKNEEVLQDLNYSYDPAGNILEIRDEAVKTIWCNNQQVDGVHQYQYDSLYRLIFATGREHEANNCSDNGTTQRFKKDKCIPLPQNAGNALALRRYAETFAYDPAGNLLLRKRSAGTYSEYDPLMPGSVCNIEQGYAPDSNRIVRSKGMDMHHDANGNLLDLFGEDTMIWDYRNQLVQVRVQVNNKSIDKYAYYQYDAQGNRIRKYNAQNGEERIYIGGYEYYTKGNDTLETVHVMDDKNRMAILEKPNGGKEVVRYQLNNHLGSGTLELAGDDAAHLIAYEEYYAYGGTACFAACDSDEYSLKRYRYSGKERDEESGLYYYGARYYAPWMGRWCSCDPAGAKAGLNTFLFVKNNPIILIDIFGLSDSEYLKDNIKQTVSDISNDTLETGKSIVNGLYDYGKNIGDSLSKGEYSEAIAKSLKVDALADSHLNYTTHGSTNSEAAGLIVGDIIGTNNLMEAYTGEKLNGTQLSELDRNMLAVSGLTKIALTSLSVAGGIQKIGDFVPKHPSNYPKSNIIQHNKLDMIPKSAPGSDTIVLGHYKLSYAVGPNNEIVKGVVNNTLENILMPAAEKLGGKTLSHLPYGLEHMLPSIHSADRIIFFTSSQGLKGLTASEMTLIQSNKALLEKTIFVTGAM